MKKEAPYKKLLTYKYSVVIYDFTKVFVGRYLPGREYLRTREQMVQAARSGKQNIAEGASQQTSLKGYIKLVGVARGSLEELLEDFQDFAREKKIIVWDRRDRRFKGKRIFINDNQPIPPLPPIPPNLNVFVNVMIDLITRTNYLLDQQRRGLEAKHEKEGGFTENLYRKRSEYRKKQN